MGKQVLHEKQQQSKNLFSLAFRELSVNNNCMTRKLDLAKFTAKFEFFNLIDSLPAQSVWCLEYQILSIEMSFTNHTEMINCVVDIFTC